MKRIMWFACVMLTVLPAAAQYSKYMLRDKAPALTRAETAGLRKLANSLTVDEPSERLKLAGTALESAETTNPVFRQSLETVKAMDRAVANTKAGAKAADNLAALYNDPAMSKTAMAYCLPAFLPRIPKEQRLAALDAIESRAMADGLLDETARLSYLMARATAYSELEDRENAIATLESAVESKGLAGCGDKRITSKDRWPFVPNKKELLAKATPEQIERIAAIQDKWAAVVERDLGAEPRAWVVGAELRAGAAESRRLAAMKRAAAESKK